MKSPTVRNIKQLAEVVDAMWLIGAQTFTVSYPSELHDCYSKKKSFVNYLKKRKIHAEMVGDSVSIHLPYRKGYSNWNPYNSKRVLEL